MNPPQARTVDASFGAWRQFFVETFDDLHDDIVEILNASDGVARFRESWLQGELYLAARRHPSLGLHPWPNCRLDNYGSGRAFPDFAFYDDRDALVAVGEMKVLASTFQYKMFSGGPLRPWLALLRRDGVLDIDDIALKQVNQQADSLLNDVRRLRRYRSADVARFMVLVFHDTVRLDESDEGLGDVLRGLRLWNEKGTIHTASSPKGVVEYRVWDVTASAI